MDLWALSDLSTPWCVHVVATLRIADHIAAGNPEIDKLAAKSGADRNSLHRVLRHLVSKGVFEEPAPGRFALNEAARALLDGPLRVGFDLDSFGGRMAHAWGTLLSAVRTGRPAYQEAFGHGFWEDLDAHPEIAASFDALMGPAGHGVPDPNVLVDPADWKSVRTVVDIGGGTPRTVARSGEVFQAAGVADRVTIVGQSFFDPLPAGRDLYMLKSVLSDWPNREATAILKRCAEAARPSGRVVVFTGAGPGEAASPALLMMVLVGGKDRTLEELREMAREAGLEVRAVGRQPSGRVIVECRPVAAPGDLPR
jgi:hypothetical protein